MPAPTRYEAYCDHCKQGVLSRDSLVMQGGVRLCLRCCQAHQAMEERVRRLSGRLLFTCVLAGALLGYAIGSYVGLYPGVIAGLVAAGLIETR
ncbi:MAG: hypothetical protein QHJ73_18115, partial [Armatimonadota bacterium]|nr:hypothetical protein [Armatimonadota bacterium]